MGLNHGGWCPPGRICEDGTIPEHFHLKETPKERDESAPNIPRSQRTIWNVRDSDGSLIFWDEEVTKLHSDKGTKLALDTAKKLGKPYLIMAPKVSNVEQIRNWVEKNRIQILSVGGPSEASSLGIYEKVYGIITEIFKM